MKIYNELESLGFFEWLKEKGFGSGFTPIILDAQPIDSIERSGYNAIAFRWFREKYKLELLIEKDDIGQYYFSIKGLCDYCFETYEEAEFECIEKLIEIAKERKK
jgi:hypothetical protein